MVPGVTVSCGGGSLPVCGAGSSESTSQPAENKIEPTGSGARL